MCVCGIGNIHIVLPINNPSTHPSIRSSISNNRLFRSSGSQALLRPLSAVIGRRLSDTVDKSPFFLQSLLETNKDKPPFILPQAPQTSNSPHANCATSWRTYRESPQRLGERANSMQKGPKLSSEPTLFFTGPLRPNRNHMVANSDLIAIW